MVSESQRKLDLLGLSVVMTQYSDLDAFTTLFRRFKIWDDSLFNDVPDLDGLIARRHPQYKGEIEDMLRDVVRAIVADGNPGDQPFYGIEGNPSDYRLTAASVHNAYIAFLELDQRVTEHDAAEFLADLDATPDDGLTLEHDFVFQDAVRAGIVPDDPNVPRSVFLGYGRDSAEAEVLGGQEYIDHLLERAAAQDYVFAVPSISPVD